MYKHGTRLNGPPTRSLRRSSTMRRADYARRRIASGCASGGTSASRLKSSGSAYSRARAHWSSGEIRCHRAPLQTDWGRILVELRYLMFLAEADAYTPADGAPGAKSCWLMFEERHRDDSAASILDADGKLASRVRIGRRGALETGARCSGGVSWQATVHRRRFVHDADSSILLTAMFRRRGTLFSAKSEPDRMVLIVLELSLDPGTILPYSQFHPDPPSLLFAV